MVDNVFNTACVSPYNKSRLIRFVQKTLPDTKIRRIVSVHNEYLSKAFKIRKFEHSRYQKKFRLIELLHATSAAHVEAILQSNLDWRKVTRSRFGLGISFSDDARYADMHCNRRNGRYRAFIVCDVLIGNEERVGVSYQRYPPQEIDTFSSFLAPVWVKFDDFTYNPKFVVYYEWPEDIITRTDLDRQYIMNKRLRRQHDNDDLEHPECTAGPIKKKHCAQSTFSTPTPLRTFTPGHNQFP